MIKTLDTYCLRCCTNSEHEKKWSQLIAGRQAALNAIGKQFRDSISLPSPLLHAKSPNPTRLVSTWYGRHAEYEVILTCGKQQWISWEQFSKFSLLAAAACTEKTAKLQGGLVSHRDGPARSQVPQSRVSVEEMQVAK